MKTLILTRTGSPIMYGKDTSARGEADTIPIFEHLINWYPGPVIVLGALRGDIPQDTERVRYVTMPEIGDVIEKGLVRYIKPKILEERTLPIAQLIADSDPLCFIETMGPTPTWSWPDNPNCALPYDFAILYSAPILYTMNYCATRLGTRRCGIVTDPKCYKRDSEMGSMWPGVIPSAILSQENRIWDRKIIGTKFRCHAVHAHCEYWHTDGMEYIGPHEKIGDCMIAANTHVGASLLERGRDEVWLEILSQAPDGTTICGNGWDRVPYKEWGRLNWIGCLPTLQHVYDNLRWYKGGPMIPQTRGFNTTKPRLYALNDCCPYMYGDGTQHLTYDVDERVLPLDHYSRWPAAMSNGGITDAQRADTIAHVLEATKLNWTTLHNLIRDIESCDMGPEWLATYGGYVTL